MINLERRFELKKKKDYERQLILTLFLNIECHDRHY